MPYCLREPRPVKLMFASLPLKVLLFEAPISTMSLPIWLKSKRFAGSPQSLLLRNWLFEESTILTDCVEPEPQLDNWIPLTVIPELQESIKTH